MGFHGSRLVRRHTNSTLRLCLTFRIRGLNKIGQQIIFLGYIMSWLIFIYLFIYSKSYIG